MRDLFIPYPGSHLLEDKAVHYTLHTYPYPLPRLFDRYTQHATSIKRVWVRPRSPTYLGPVTGEKLEASGELTAPGFLLRDSLSVTPHPLVRPQLSPSIGRTRRGSPGTVGWAGERTPNQEASPDDPTAGKGWARSR
ncbi:hypothetical protein BHE74_00041872, partial [Ensete ventricosum]